MRKRMLTTVLTVLLLVASAKAEPTTTTAFVRMPATAATPPPATRPVSTQPTLQGAAWLSRHGRYDEAIGLYQSLAREPANALPAAVGLSQTLRMVGRYDEALAALKAASARGSADAEWHIALAETKAVVGNYEEGVAEARKVFELRDDWAPAMLCLGQALETLGKKDEAIAVYKAMEKAVAKPDFTRDAVSLTAAGTILDRLAVLTGKKASEQAANVLNNYYQKAYQEADKEYWPAHLAAAVLLLAKHKPDQAAAELNLAQKLNPNLPDMHVARGALALSNWMFEQALAEADRALKTNPRHADALLLKAAVLMRWRKYDQVAPEIEKVLQFNPRHLDALSLMAALHVSQRQEDKAQPFIQRALKINPRYGELYDTIGEQLSSSRQFPQAEKYLQKAMEISPELAGPVTDLGLLYLQTGQEDLAKQTLDKAFALDDFRGDILNYLKLLDQLGKFQVRQTPHFIIKVDGEADAVLLDWLGDQAEKIHAEVSGDFGYVPPEKTLVELFPTHAQFSVRITGRGWIGTVGACTGRVIAMPAPDPLRGGFGTFNWAVVLRHEYTHVVTLSATGNRIPHWFTEACAVWEQPDRRNFEAVGLLVDALQQEKLFPVKSLDWGFIRPTPGGGSRGLAYAQSELIFEYVVATKGFDAILAMLKGFRDGQTQAEVFRNVLGTSEEQFDKDFCAWTVKQAESWGFDPTPLGPLAAKAPTTLPTMPTMPSTAPTRTVDEQARLAAAHYRNGRLPQAESIAREVLKSDPKNRRALEVLGAVLVARKQYDEALGVADRLLQAHDNSAVGYRVRAEALLAKRQWTGAIAALESYKRLREVDPFGYEKLADLYMQMGRPDAALPNLVELHRRTVKDSKYARQVADIYRTGSTPEKALEFYEQVIQINPYDAGAYTAMASLYLRSQAYDRAILAAHSACLLEPKSADAWARLAAVNLRVARATGSTEKFSNARSAAEKALALDANSQAREILEIIQQEQPK